MSIWSAIAERKKYVLMSKELWKSENKKSISEKKCFSPSKRKYENMKTTTTHYRQTKMFPQTNGKHETTTNHTKKRS